MENRMCTQTSSWHAKLSPWLRPTFIHSWNPGRPLITPISSWIWTQTKSNMFFRLSWLVVYVLRSLSHFCAELKISVFTILFWVCGSTFPVQVVSILSFSLCGDRMCDSSFRIMSVGPFLHSILECSHCILIIHFYLYDFWERYT